MAKTHSSLTGADLHNPKGIGVETHSTSSLIISQSLDSHTGVISSSAHFIPSTTNKYDLGTAQKAFRKLYIISNSIEFVNNAGSTVQTLTADASGLSVGSGQISGSAISGSGLMINGSGNITGDITIGGNMTFGDAASDSVSITADLTSHLIPNADATYDLGSSSQGWNDLHLGSGGVINFDGGDVTATHSANLVSIAGGNTRVIRLELDSAADYLDVDTDLKVVAGADITLDPGGNNVKPGSDNADALGVSGTAWSDLFLGDGAVINFNAGDVTATHSSNLLSIAGGNTRVIRLEIDGSSDYIDVSTDLQVIAAADITLDPAGGNVKPASNDDAALGVAGTGWSDLFLAEGAVINWDSGDFTATQAGNLLTLTGGNTRVDRLELDSANDYLDVDTDLKIVAAADITLDPGGNNVKPGGDSADDLGVSGTAWRKLFVDDIELNSQGSITNAVSASVGYVSASGDMKIDGNTALNGNVDLGDATGDTITATGRFDSDIVPSTDSARDLGTSALQFAEAHIDTGYIDSLTTTTNVDIDDSGGDGAMDGVIIGAAAAAAGTFTTLNTTGLTTLGDASGDTLTINAATINPANIAAGTDNSVVVYNGSTLVTDEIDSRVWGSTLVDTDGSGANNELATWSDADSIIGEGNLTFDGSKLTVTGNAVVSSHISSSASITGSNLYSSGILDVASTGNFGGTVTAVGSFIIGSADMNEADLEKLDGITNGAGAANKALVLDGNADIASGLRNITLSGTLSDGNYTFDTSGNVSGLGTVGSGNITSTGTVQGTVITATTGFAPDAQDGAYLGTSALQFSDLFLADAAVIAFGDDGDVTLTHVADTGLLLTDNSGVGTTQLQFGDSGTYISQLADGTLGLVADTEIDISATTIDINGAVAFDGALTGITNITLSGTLSDGNYTFDTNGNVSGLGTVGCGAITSTGTSAFNDITVGGGYGSTGTTISSAGVISTDGAATFASDVTIYGDLHVTGSTVTVDATTLNIADKNITIGSGSTSSATMNEAGLDFGLNASVSNLRYRHSDATLTSSVDLGAPQFHSSITTGTAPLTVQSTTVVSNLNADKLDGQEGSYYTDFSNMTVTAGEITHAMLAGDLIDGDNIGDDVINSEHYAAGSIDHEHLANDIIDGDNIQDDVINSEHYAAASIDNEHLADDAVDSDELAAGAVDDAHLSDGVATGLAGAGTTATSGVINVIGGTGITVNADEITTTDGDIVHDNLSGFVADEHIAHSGVSISAGGILSGGGTIAASRTITLASSDVVHDSTTGFVANEHIDHTGVTLTAGDGMTGGGTIASNRTFTVVGGDGITANSDDMAVTPAQTTITSIYNTGLKVGYDASDNICFATGSDGQISYYQNGIEEFRMTAGGTFHADADVVAYSSTVASDMNLKENITDMKYGLADIVKLRGVEYDWKRDDMGHDVGVLAQEVEAVIPELVKEHDGLHGRGKFKSVDYNKLVPVLIESIKELKSEIDDLKKNKN